MQGYKELQDKLNKLSNLDLSKSITESCLLLENTAKRNCPVDSGQLRRSITHKVDKNEGEVYTNVEYAPYVEYGTGLFSTKGNGRNSKWTYKDVEGNWHTTAGQKPQPFMHPALTTNRTRIKSLIDKEIKDIIK